MSDAPGLLVLSGPSGVGKTTIGQGLLRDPRFGRAVTATTRRPRDGEVDGRDYLFLSMVEFEQGVDAGRFLEHALVHGNRYGTPRDEVERIQAGERICLLIIDVQGAAQLRDAGVEALYVFLAPPSWDELERRLRGRDSEDPEVIERRLGGARVEYDRRGEYDTVVINDDVERAIGEIQGLALADHS